MNETQRSSALRLADSKPDFCYSSLCDWADEAAALLRELLATPVVNQQMTTEPAEPVQEPAIWIQSNHLQHAKNGPHFARTGPTKLQSDYVPLYAHPQQRRPLTDDEALAIIRATPQEDVTKEGWIRRQRLSWVRAIEAAHGIIGEPT